LLSLYVKSQPEAKMIAFRIFLMDGFVRNDLISVVECKKH